MGQRSSRPTRPFHRGDDGGRACTGGIRGRMVPLARHRGRGRSPLLRGDATVRQPPIAASHAPVRTNRGSSGGVPLAEQPSHQRADQFTIPSGQSTQQHSRAARLLWSGSGGRGGVSELGGGEQPTAEASAASTSGSPSARTRNVAVCARRPRDAGGTTAFEGHPRASRPSVCPASLGAALEMCLAQAGSAPDPVLGNRGGRPAVPGRRPPRPMIARGRAGAPRTVRAIAQARRASGQARP
jgi:hypothetical protein